MSRSSRAVQWVLTWVLVGLLLATVFFTAAFHGPLLRAVGLDATGAPTTLNPTVLAPPPGADAGPPAEPAAPVTGGTAPARAALEAKLQALDTTALRKDGAVVNAYQVVDVETGEVLAEANQDKALIPASNAKLLTVVALLSALDGDQRIATRVVSPKPGSLVLVGGGDPLLTNLAPAPGSYPQTASLQQLAAQTAATLKAEGLTSVTLGYDSSLFTGTAWNSTWPSTYADQVTPIVALWADEGRDAAGKRSPSPDQAAAQAFAAHLSAAGVQVTGQPAPAVASGKEVARVESPPVTVLAEVAMRRSNNSFTEVLARHVALSTDEEASFDGAVAALTAQLKEAGLWQEGAALLDASGLSRSNLVSASMLAGAVRKVASDQRLAPILDGLPVAGVSGTLADRFSDELSRPARGIARAKTGTLSKVATLAGTTVTADGRVVAYAFMTNGSPDGWAAKVWLDQAVGVLTSCGC